MKKITEVDTYKVDHESPPSTPHWVKVFGIVGMVLVLLVVILHLTGHSPFMHMSHMKYGVQTP